jgi:hypothetical protein
MQFIKDPDADLDFKRDWAAWLAEVDDTIESSEWFHEGLELGEGGETHDGTSATIWLKGGAVGQRYDVTNRIVTVGGRTDDRTFTIVVRER